jgi:hemerythrin-like domain-containing protein
MTPTDMLKHEHKIINMVLDGLQRQCERIERTGDVSADKLEQALDFLRNFADRCHHAKEERHLFAAMHERGMPIKAGPIAVMLAEHEEGRRRIAAAAAALPMARGKDKAAVEEVRQNLLAYVALLRAHIDKENLILYPMADRILNDDDQRRLEEAFEKVEAEEIGPGVHEKYHRLAHELAED